MDFGLQALVQSPNHAEATRLICHCLNVSEHEIRDAIAEHEPQSVRAVSQVCGAGAGCMSCHRHIRRMLNERVVQRRSQMLGETMSAEQPCDDRRHC